MSLHYRTSPADTITESSIPPHADSFLLPSAAFDDEVGVDARSVALAVMPAWTVEPASVTAAEPTVGLGTEPVTPFMAVAVSESCANPTDGGVARKTEYTFFRNESPTIQGGALPPDEPMEKNAPTHMLEDVPWLTRKSAFEIGQDIVLLPKRIVTFTVVSHAGRRSDGPRKRGAWRTHGIGKSPRSAR